MAVLWSMTFCTSTNLNWWFLAKHKPTVLWLFVRCSVEVYKCIPTQQQFMWVAKMPYFAAVHVHIELSSSDPPFWATSLCTIQGLVGDINRENILASNRQHVPSFLQWRNYMHMEWTEMTKSRKILMKCWLCQYRNDVSLVMASFSEMVRVTGFYI